MFDRETNTAKSCICREREIEEIHKKFADFPTSFRDVKLRDFDINSYNKANQAEMIKMLKIAKYYLDNFSNYQERGAGLYIFSSKKGSGKTRYAISVGNALIEKNIKVKFATSLAIIQEIRASWSDEEKNESKLLQDLIDCDVLIIDDFGTETAKKWIDERFYQIVNERYIAKKITIFTSNYDISELEYDSRITSRIAERSIVLHFAEESIREKKQKKLNEEIAKAIS